MAPRLLLVAARFHHWIMRHWHLRWFSLCVCVCWCFFLFSRCRQLPPRKERTKRLRGGETRARDRQKKKMGNETGELKKPLSQPTGGTQWQKCRRVRRPGNFLLLPLFSNGSDDQREQHSRPENTFGTFNESREIVKESETKKVIHCPLYSCLLHTRQCARLNSPSVKSESAFGENEGERKRRKKENRSYWLFDFTEQREVKKEEEN